VDIHLHASQSVTNRGRYIHHPRCCRRTRAKLDQWANCRAPKIKLGRGV